MPKSFTTIEVRLKLFEDKKEEVDAYCLKYHLDYQGLVARAVQEYIKYERTNNSLVRKEKIKGNKEKSQKLV